MKNNLQFVETSLVLLGFVLLLTACEKNIDRLPYQVDNIFTVEEETVLSKYLETDKFNYIRNVTEADQYKVFPVLLVINRIKALRMMWHLVGVLLVMLRIETLLA